MNPEEKQMLEETLELAEENNKILRKLQSTARWGRIFRVLYWIVILGLAVGAYYYVQPFIDQLLEIYGGAKEATEALGNLIQIEE